MLLGAPILHAQKTKLKDAGVSAANDSTAKANAAARGSALMQAARDSLNASNLKPPREVSDTFALAPVRNPSLSKLTQAQFDDAFARLEAARKLLDLAEQRLAASEASHSFSDEALLQAKGQLLTEKERLEKAKGRLEVIVAKWKEERGITETAPESETIGADKPDSGGGN
jgi:hypothetical protein